MYVTVGSSPLRAERGAARFSAARVALCLGTRFDMQESCNSPASWRLPMSARTETISKLVKEVEDRIEPEELIKNARNGLTRLVSDYPVATLVGAFALGFTLARLVRSMGED
jgi:hypothetical protein